MDGVDYLILFIVIISLFVAIAQALKKYCSNESEEIPRGEGRPRRRVIRTIRIDPAPSTASPYRVFSDNSFMDLERNSEISEEVPNRAEGITTSIGDRQGNIYTVSDDIATNNAVPPRFTDFFYLEPGSEEAARIRAQLEKDDKELPSYEEVLRMTAMAQTAQTATTVAALPAAIPPPMPTALGASNSSFATTATDISLPPAPPYTEIDMNATVPVAATAAATTPQTYATPPTTTTTITTTATATATPQLVGIVPSTSRAAATLEVVTGPSMTAA